MTQAFYDDLSQYYHLIFEDWDKSIERQSDILTDVIKAHWPDHSSLLDVSCGIGTQALGLAQKGFVVTGTDLSPKAIARAKQEAISRNINVQFDVADMRTVDAKIKTPVDLLISCDNSISHLLSDDEILQAFRSFLNCLKSGGGCLITLRDYDQEEKVNVKFNPHGVRYVDGVKYTLFQTWEFEGHFYNLSTYCLIENQDAVETKVFKTRYYAVSTDTIKQLLKLAGFVDIRQVDCGYYQPVLIATKP